MLNAMFTASYDEVQAWYRWWRMFHPFASTVSSDGTESTSASHPICWVASGGKFSLICLVTAVEVREQPPHAAAPTALKLSQQSVRQPAMPGTNIEIISGPGTPSTEGQGGPAPPPCRNTEHGGRGGKGVKLEEAPQ